MAQPVRDPETVETAMADGTVLLADIYRPAGRGAHPVLLMRQPYGRRIASTVVLAHPAWYASQGYVVMVQDVRGRGGSGGRFRILQDDADDGARTLSFAAGLDGGNGQVATYGFSYHGMNQYLALAGAGKAGTKRPDAMAVAMAAWDIRNHWVREGGAFRQHDNQLWACQMAAENARRVGDFAAAHALRSATAMLCSGPISARLDALERFAKYSHFHQWMADAPDAFQQASPHLALADDRLDVPVLHIGGWQDVMLDGTFAAYAAFRAGPCPQSLLIGPWMHLPWGSSVGTLDCGPQAGEGVDADILAFFDAHLKGRGSPRARLRLFDPGRKCYSNYDAFPLVRPCAMHLASSGRAAPTCTDGHFTDGPGPAGQDMLVHDPWRPAPALGLHLGTPGGYQDRAGVDNRADVAVYTGPALENDLILMGPVRAELWVESDRPSFDLHCVLSIVRPDGSAWTVTGGHLTVPVGNTGGAHLIAMR